MVGKDKKDPKLDIHKLTSSLKRAHISMPANLSSLGIEPKEKKSYKRTSSAPSRLENSNEADDQTLKRIKRIKSK